MQESFSVKAEQVRERLRKFRERYRINEGLWGFHSETYWKMVLNSVYGRLAQHDTSPLIHILCTTHYDSWIRKLDKEVYS